jgi:hypothetical protein
MHQNQKEEKLLGHKKVDLKLFAGLKGAQVRELCASVAKTDRNFGHRTQKWPHKISAAGKIPRLIFADFSNNRRKVDTLFLSYYYFAAEFFIIQLF